MRYDTQPYKSHAQSKLCSILEDPAQIIKDCWAFYNPQQKHVLVKIYLNLHPLNNRLEVVNQLLKMYTKVYLMKDACSHVTVDMKYKEGIIPELIKIGDLITGIDRSYPRSIYRLFSVEPFLVAFVSFKGHVAREENTLPYSGSLTDFRLATLEEIELSRRLV